MTAKVNLNRKDTISTNTNKLKLLADDNQYVTNISFSLVSQSRSLLISVSHSLTKNISLIDAVYMKSLHCEIYCTSISHPFSISTIAFHQEMSPLLVTCLTECLFLFRAELSAHSLDQFHIQHLHYDSMNNGFDIIMLTFNKC